MKVFGHGPHKESAYLALDNPRIRKFRKKYRVGHIVAGIILEYDSPRLAWVLVDDLRMLAWVTRNYFRGQRLHLVVENMYPEIVLKEVDLSDCEHGGLSIIV